MRRWPCPLLTCKKVCRSPGGLTQHMNLKHRHHTDFGKRDKTVRRTFHPLLDGLFSYTNLTYFSLIPLLQEPPVILMATT